MKIKRMLKRFTILMYLMSVLFVVLSILSLFKGYYLIGIVGIIGSIFVLKIAYDINKEVKCMDD